MEVWKVVPEAADYEVSNLGNIRRKTDGKSTIPGYPRKKYLNKKTGYLNVTMTVPGRFKKTSKTFAAHRLVAEAFVDGYEPGYQVHFKNGDKQDCRAENLEWKPPYVISRGIAVEVFCETTGVSKSFNTMSDLHKELGFVHYQIWSSHLHSGQPVTDPTNGNVWYIQRQD